MRLLLKNRHIFYQDYFTTCLAMLAEQIIYGCVVLTFVGKHKSRYWGPVAPVYGDGVVDLLYQN